MNNLLCLPLSSLFLSSHSQVIGRHKKRRANWKGIGGRKLKRKNGEVMWWEEKGKLQDEWVLWRRTEENLYFLNQAKMHSQQILYNKTTPVRVNKRAPWMQNCSWLCFTTGAPESALNCQAVFLAGYHSHPKKLDHAVIQPIITHRQIKKKNPTTTHTLTNAHSHKPVLWHHSSAGWSH